MPYNMAQCSQLLLGTVAQMGIASVLARLLVSTMLLAALGQQTFMWVCLCIIIAESFYTIVLRPSHVFQCMQENRKGLVGLVM